MIYGQQNGSPSDATAIVEHPSMMHFYYKFIIMIERAARNRWMTFSIGDLRTRRPIIAGARRVRGAMPE